MLKISPILNNVGKSVEKSVSRYIRKDTINAKYNRNMDMAAAAGVGVLVQIFRLPTWEPQDIAISAFIMAGGVKGIFESAKSRIQLFPIIKRAKQIKKASKNNI